MSKRPSSEQRLTVADLAAALRERLQTPEGLEVFARWNMLGLADRFGIPDTPLARRNFITGQLEQLEAWSRPPALAPSPSTTASAPSDDANEQ